MPSETTVFETASNHIVAGIIMNRNRHPNARGYSRQRFGWSCDLMDMPLAAFQIVRAVLPLPSDRLLREKLVDTENQISAALTNLIAMDDMLELGLSVIPGPETCELWQPLR